MESIESPREHPFDYEAIYSEAYALYRQGFRYYFSKAEEEVLKAHNEVFETPCQEKEVISRYFRQPHENERGEFYTATDILLAVGASPVLRLTVEKIGAAMRSLGYQPHRLHGRRGFRVVAFKAEEIEQNRRILAYDAKDNDDSEGDRGDGGS